MSISKDKFFKPSKLSAEDKAAQTKDTVRGILAAEAAARDKKTEYLKSLRLAQEKTEPIKTKSPGK